MAKKSAAAALIKKGNGVRRTFGDIVFESINSFVMIFLIFITGYPILHLLFLSLSGDIVGNEFLFAPKGFTLRYYENVFSDDSIWNAAFISASRTILGVLGMLCVTFCAAFAMSDRKLVGYKAIWRFFLIPMFIGGGMIPSYLLMQALGLLRTFWIYVIPGLFGGTFTVILMRTFVEQLPDGLIEAAEIDGANDLVLCFKIVVPLSTPILATIALQSGVGAWNAYTDTLIYCAEVEELHTLQYTLMLLLKRYESASIEAIEEMAKQNTRGYVSPIGLKAALTFVTMVPIMCLYPFLQKYFIKGMMIGAIKA